MALHFDVTGDNSNFLRKLEETKRGVAEAAKFMESQGRKIDSSLNSVSFGDALKKQIHDGSQSVNGLTAQIIKQKAVIKDIEHDVRTLGEAYRKAGAGTQKGNALFADFKSAKASLQEEKNALFGLQTEQAQARLSVRKLKDEYSLYHKEGQNVVDSNNQMAISFKKTLAAIGGTAMIKKFVSDVLRIRGEFQQLDVAFTTLLQSKEKANALMAQMVQTAAKTPFNLTELATGARQLVAYGFASEEVNGTLVRLGNIASGLGLPLERLTYLYGTTMTQGRLYARDLMQFTTSGIPMLQGLADMYGVSTAKVNEMVTAGKIGFPEVQKVVENLTNEGGKFFNLMEEQSKTITGKISNLGDAMDGMFNSIGQANEGVINDSIDGLKYLVENYEQVGRILLGLVATYGTYRTALLINSVLELGSAKAVWTKITATKAATLAQATYNKVLAMNPYVAVGMAVVSLGVAMWALRDSTSAAEKAQKRFNEDKEEAIKREAAHKSHIESLISTIQDETTAEMNRIGAMEQLKSAYPHIFAKYVDEKGHLRDIIGYKKEIEEFDAKVSVGVSKRQADRAKQELIKVNKEINYRQGSTTGASKFFRDKTTSELREMQSELLESYQLKQSDYDKLAELEAKAKEKLDSATVKQDKSYWEKQKKDAQSQLDALSDIEAAGKKGAALKDKIVGYEKKINKAFSTNTTKQESAADKLREQQEKLALLMDKQGREQIRSEQDLQNQVDQSRIDAMADGFDKQQEQRDLNNKKEIQSLKRQKEDYIRAIIQAEKEKFDTQEDVKAQQKKGYVKQDFDPSSVNVDTSKFDKIISNTETKQGVNEWQKREDAMNEYLLKYGTFTQKKEAIDKKYQDAIDKETNLGNKNALQKEWKEATANLDLSKLKQDINWEMIFGDLSKVTKEQLTNIKKQLSEFKKSDEFKNATPEQIQVIEGALNSINNAMVDKGGFFGGMTDSIKELKIATEELKKAEEELAEANKKGTEAQKEEAQKKVNQAQNKQQNAETNVTKSSDKTIQHLTSVGDAISQLGSTAEMSLSSFGDAAGSIVDAFSEAGSKLGGIVGAVFSILEGIQNQGIDGFIGNIFDNIMGVAGSVWNTLTFGAFDALGLSGESDESLEKDLERLSQSNEDLKIALDNLAERMEESSVADATDVYEKQKAALSQSEANTKEAMRREAASYSNGFLGIGGSHSSNAKINSSMSSSDWSKISEIVGHTINSASDFWNLTSEEMANVATEANDLYTKIKVHADDGHRDAAQYMDTYISYYKQLEELENAWREKLTSASFGTIRDDFKSALMDMEADTEDFVKNFEEMMKNAMFEDLMTKKYDVMLKAWYKDFATAMDGGKLTKDEQNDLKGKWDKIVNEGIAERDALYEMMGWETSSSTSQNSTKGMSQSMDQDTGNELNGRFTAFQISNEEIKNAMLSMLISVNLISVSVSNNSITLIEIRNIMISSNSYLEDIAKYTKELIGLKQTIANIESSAKSMAGK